ncbi:MAG: electron transfer flavoprotein subunit alpha/FixB family protein [Actinobacteria bacterium]|nr:electron transfer flavoprotein subunit alpha/FixB family protein [Actinomycetota bacterium]
MSAIAVIPVRGGLLPLGADEAVAEAGGVALVVGDGTDEAATALAAATSLLLAEAGDFAPAAWAVALRPHIAAAAVVVLPASPDGRDLAPRLAYELDRPLLAGALSVDEHRAVLVRRGGLVVEEHDVAGPVVATLLPGVRGFEPVATEPRRARLDLEPPPGADAEVLDVTPPDPATMDLAEARRIVAGGAGLGGPEPFELLARVAPALGASFGASRVAADVGWAPQDRFIGTTGVVVDPDLYIALGISGAVQHVTGLGQPDHVIAVNTDASAPMMAMADLAIVADAPAVLVALADRLGVAHTASSGDPRSEVSA